MGHLRDSQVAIASALDSVTGISGFTDAPSILKPGVAWSRLVDMNATGVPGIFEVNWEVCVVSGSTPEQALAMIDDQADALISALQTAVYVRRVALPEFKTAGESIFGITLDTVRE